MDSSEQKDNSQPGDELCAKPTGQYEHYEKRGQYDQSRYLPTKSLKHFFQCHFAFVS